MRTSNHNIIWSVLFATLMVAIVSLPTAVQSAPMKYQVDYLLDDSGPEKIIGRGGRGDIWVANGFTVQDGGEVIVSIEASFDDTKGWPLGVHLYDDPDDDGVPDDLVLLQSVQTTFPARGACHRFPIPPTEVVGVFFVALSYPDNVGGTDYPLLLDITTDRHQTWYVETSSPGSLDPANLPNPILTQSSVPGYGGQYLIRAIGVPKPVTIVGVTYGDAAGALGIEWGSTLGAFYGILKAEDLGLGDWAVLDPYRVPVAGATGPTSLFSIPVEGDAACYRVRRTTPPAIFEEDFETGAEGWTHTTREGSLTDWTLGAPENGPFSAHSGNHVYGTNLDGNYANPTHAALLSPPINLPDQPAAIVSFWYIVDTALAGHDLDTFVVEIIDDPSTPWHGGHQLMEIQQESTWQWKHGEVLLPQSLMNSTRYLRFILDDDGNSDIGRGVYLDDVRIPQPADHFVSPTGLDRWPYTSWSTAARNIQDAIDAAKAGSTVWVTNGVYDTGGVAVHGSLVSRIAIGRGIEVRSLNGPEQTLIVGQGPAGGGPVRCAYVGDGAHLVGFTLTNGHTRTEGGGDDSLGGGAWCEPSAVVSDCIITGNSAFFGGGNYRGTVLNCIIAGNSARFGGGSFLGSFGGSASSSLQNCLIYGNEAGIEGGGVQEGTVLNCTIVNNQAGLFGGGIGRGKEIRNCIVYYNVAPTNANWTLESPPEPWPSGTMDNTCTTPGPPSGSGTGNISSVPGFVNKDLGDYHLLDTSLCINAGLNAAWMSEAVDLDGNPRIVNGKVDMGAFEVP